MKEGPVSSVASPNCWLTMLRPPRFTMSWSMIPEVWPLPYSIENFVPFDLKVLDLDESYLLCKSQAQSLQGQLIEGTHKFEDPVSKTTWNCWAGDPIVIGP